MKDFYSKTEYNYDDILGLIENEVEESIYLDFKDAKALDKSDNKKKDISKDVSSFANSDGGIIVYGITEENHKASKVSFVNGNEYTKEWLEQIINSSIQRRIPELLVYPIRKDGNIEETIYIVKIPKSLEAPHLSKDKRYYKRFNFESVPMEEYEIRQSYGKKLKSKLLLERWSISEVKDHSYNNDKYKFTCEVQVFNDGDITEANFKVNIYFNNINKHITFSWPQNSQNYDYTKFDDNRIKISVNSIAPIFPAETVNSVRFEITVAKSKILEAFNDLEIDIKLLYVNGEDNMKTNLLELLKKLPEYSNE